MTEQDLQQSIYYVRNGQHQAARIILTRIVRGNPQSEQGWLWLSAAVQRDEEKLYCLQRVLAINPHNQAAQRGVAILMDQTSLAAPSHSSGKIVPGRLSPSAFAGAAKCPQCGAPIRKDSQLCPSCGLTLPVQEKSSARPRPSATAPGSQTTTRSQHAGEFRPPELRRRFGWHRWLLFLGGGATIVVVATLVVILASGMGGLKKTQPPAFPFSTASTTAPNVDATVIATLQPKGEITRIAWSPEGSVLAVGTTEHACVFYVDTLEVLHCLEMDAVIESLAFSPDGLLLALGSERGRIGVFEVATGQRRQTLKGEVSHIQSIAFSPDGTRIASRAGDTSVRLWDLATGATVWAEKVPGAGGGALAFSPLGDIIAIGRYEQDLTVVELWDATTGKVSSVLEGWVAEGLTVRPLEIAFSPDGTRLAGGMDDHNVRVWDVARKAILWSEKTHSWVRSVAISPDGTMLAAGAERLYLWDLETGQEIQTENVSSEVVSIAFSPDGAFLAVASEAGVVRLWEIAAGSHMQVLKEGQGSAGAVFSADGTMLAGLDGQAVRLWAIPGGQELRVLHREETVYGASFSPNGAQLATGAWDGVWIWDMASGEVVSILEGPTGPVTGVTSVAFSPDGALLAAGTSKGETWLWETMTGESLLVMFGLGDEETFAPVTSVDFSPDGTLLAIGVCFTDLPFSAYTQCSSGAIRFWETRTRTAAGSPQILEAGVASVDFSPDGALLATGMADGTVRLWRLDTAEPTMLWKRETRAGPGSRPGVSFSPDGTLLATYSGVNYPGLLWRVDLGTEVGVLPDTWGGAHVAFSPGGKLLAQSGRDGMFLRKVRAEREIWVPSFLAVEQEKQETARQTTAAALPQPTPTIVPSTEPLAPAAQPPIAFVSDRDGNWEIYLMNADGSNPTRLTSNPASDTVPNWSPDGRRIAFKSDRDGNDEIYVMDANGNNLVRLTNNPARDSDPTWSPDGRRIAFLSNRDTAGSIMEIYVMNADGSDQRRLTTDSYAWVTASWSPDGRTIAFVCGMDSDGGHFEVCLVGSDGSNQLSLMGNEFASLFPAWSPDGHRIAFITDRDGTNEIYMVDTDGTDLVRLTNNATAWNCPAWSPDGRYIAFASRHDDNSDIDVITVPGSDPINLTNNPANDIFPMWAPRWP